MATTSSPIGVAVLGCGGISHPHFDGWQRLERAGEARLEVACDNLRERAESQAQRYGAAAAATDFAEVVQRPEVQAVDICLPHHLHLPAILAAAEAGVHVLCEKPLVLNMDEAVEAIRACRDAGVKLMTADRDRFEPPARAVKRILDAGLIGDIYHVLERHLLHKDVLTQGSRANMGWKLGKATAGGGALHRDGCYYIDTLLFWEGSGVKHVAGAEFDSFLWETEEIETTSHVLFRFNSGAIGVFEMVWCLQGPQHREIFVTGSEGYVKLEGGIGHGSDATITLYSNKLPWLTFDEPQVAQAFADCTFEQPHRNNPEMANEKLVLHVPYAGGFYAQEKELLAAIREDREPESNGIDGARALEVVEGAYLAAQERRLIEFPLRDWESLRSHRT